MRSQLVLTAAQALGRLARASGRGGGTALPGLLVEQGAPELVPQLAGGLADGCVLVSGTNGKTTTARLLASICEAAGHRVVHNRSGSNLMRGIAAALVQPARDNHHKSTAAAIGVFEVDEATLPEAVKTLQPRLVVLLNLFRDQLDRYGEVDTLLQLWRDAFAALPPDAQVVLNADDPVVAGLGRGLGERAHYYGIDDLTQRVTEREHAADFVECLQCGVPYDYSTAYYGHLGHYRCPQCGWERPQPEVRALQADVRGLSGSSVELTLGKQRLKLELALPGLYNVYNLLAAAAAARALGLHASNLEYGVQSAAPVFGRAERLPLSEGRSLVLLLTKNPVGTNQVLRLLLQEPGPQPLLLALNDYLADGEDISWIWDVDYEMLASRAGWAITSGHRAEDMALRLKYAGWPGATANAGEEHLRALPDLQQALQTALYRLLPGQTLYVLVTYTAMLEVREVLTRMGLSRPFWEA